VAAGMSPLLVVVLLPVLENISEMNYFSLGGISRNFLHSSLLILKDLFHLAFYSFVS
jgi:hypothetical protein